MTIFLLEHFSGCTPLNPCMSCIAGDFLRARLSPKDIVELTLLLIRATSSPDTNQPHYDYEKNDKELVETLNLSSRATLALAGDGIRTIGDLRKKSKGYLRGLPNIGKVTVGEIESALAGFGLTLGNKDF